MPADIREDASLHTKSGDSEVPAIADIICFSHLRWDFVFQRPQHLLSRAALGCRVFYIEEPLFESTGRPMLRTRVVEGGVVLVQPVLPEALQQGSTSSLAITSANADLIKQLLEENNVTEFVSWYYTPMALAFTRSLQPAAVVYDCMDELSGFRGAPANLLELERELMGCADVVFTGGASLYESKRGSHPHVYLFPSSVDVSHFTQALAEQEDPIDQAHIPHPRVGFYGVLDERMDFSLLARVADLRPKVQFILVGPLAKIRPGDLPRRANLHYLGSKSYMELPTYLAGWDAAMLPFALNEATRFISPTKTPEYLAARKQSVSTPIQDVVKPYGDDGLVAIAATAEAFATAVDGALKPPGVEWLAKVEAMLAKSSWDLTWEGMRSNVAVALANKHEV